MNPSSGGKRKEAMRGLRRGGHKELSVPKKLPLRKNSLGCEFSFQSYIVLCQTAGSAIHSPDFAGIIFAWQLNSP
jgi:hypothetical protein